MKMLQILKLSFCTSILLLMLGSCSESHEKSLTGNCEKHGIDVKICGFCDKSLIDSMGFCKEHNVVEALCPECQPEIVKAYKVEGDWCKEHNTPESLCKKCN